MAEDDLKWGELYRDDDTGQMCKHFPVHAGQQAILDAIEKGEARYLCALGGVNSGKTSLAMLALAQEVAKNQCKGDYLVIGPQWDVVLSSTYKRFEEVFNDWIPGKWHKHQLNPRYELDSGGTIFFRSADGNFNGIKPRMICLDEGGLISEESFHEIKGRMAFSDGEPCKLLISTTPYPNYDWIPYEIMAKADKGNANYFYLTMKSEMNPTTDEEHLEEEKKSLQPWEYQQRYEGIFAAPPNQVYDFTSCYCEVPREGLPEGLLYPGGVDFGGNDPTCALLGVLDQDDVLWLFHEYYKADKKEQDIEFFIGDLSSFNQAVKEKVKKQVVWFCDHRPEVITPLRRKGVDARKANKRKVGRHGSIEVGISLVQSRIRTGRLKIIRNSCPNLQAESLKYRYPMVDGQSVGSVPIDKHNHACDALRYLVLGIDRAAQIKTAKQMAT